MTFELSTLTKVRVLDVRTLSSKDRKPGDPVGSQLLLRTTLSIAALAMFDDKLPGTLARKATAKKQGELDGLESTELTEFGQHVKRFAWDYEQTGCAAVIDFGTGGASDIKLGDCKTHRVSIHPRQGAVDVQWSLDAPALSTETRGKLTDLKSTDIQMTLAGPTVADDPQGDIEDDDGPEPSTPRKPGAAERAAAGVKPTTAHKEPTKAEAKANAEAAFGAGDTVKGAATLSPEAAWPLPKNNGGPDKQSAPPQSVTTESVTRNPAQSRTARGREATAKALAAGVTK